MSPRTLVAVSTFGLGLLASVPVHAAMPCSAPVTARAFHQQVAAADAAYADMDLEGFRSARGSAQSMVACLAEPITPAQAAGLHRIEALGAFLARDYAAAVASLRALAAAAPGYQLPLQLAPEGHPLRTYFEIAENTVTVPAQPFEPPGAGWVQIDGTTATAWPVDRPYVFQGFDSGGNVQASKLFGAGVAPPGASLPSAAARPAPRARSTARTLGWVSGGTALLAGGLYLGARASSARFWDPSTPDTELDALRGRTNALGWASTGVGLVAVGTGGAALFVGTW